MRQRLSSSRIAVVKQFAGKSNCVFIIPCDEKQVLEAVDRAAGNHDYNYESLRKFFDVAVRMDKIPEADLHDYAKYLVEEWKLAPRLAELAVYSGAQCAESEGVFEFIQDSVRHYKGTRTKVLRRGNR